MKNVSEQTNEQEQHEPLVKGRIFNWPDIQGAGVGDTILVKGPQLELDFDSDAPLVCSRDQSGDKPCESCQ